MGNTHDVTGTTDEGKTHKLDEQFRKKCGCSCCKCMAITLCVIVILVSLTVIAVTVTNAIATKLYSSELSGRLVSMIVLAVTAAVSLSVTIYAMVGLVKRQKKPLHVAAIVLIIMAVIQSLLCGISVKVTPHDETTLTNSLAKSFNLAIEGNPRHSKLWAVTNSGLQCCGLYSPEDYRDPNIPPIFAPDVPISCCASYDPTRSDLVQEKEREACRARKEFYAVGCSGLIKAGFRNSASSVLSVTILVIVLEVLLAALCWLAYRAYKEREKKDKCNIEVEVKVESDKKEVDKDFERGSGVTFT